MPLSKADISSQGTPFILYGELYTTYDEIIENVVRRTEKNASSEQISRIGDVIIPTSGETPEEIATASCVMLPGVILAGDLNIFRTDIVDGRLISYIIRHVINKKISCVAQGKSVVHVKADELSKISVRYPGFAEQHKLLSFLELLQSRITVQRRLVEALKSYKRGALSKLFPKNGECTPEYRFGGFLVPWEEHNLGEEIEILGGNAWKSSEYRDDGEYLVITIANVTGEVFINDTIGKHLNCSGHNAFLLKENDILVSLTGNVGRVSKMSSVKGVLNQRVAKIILRRHHNEVGT